jgi:hypothetical protein
MTIGFLTPVRHVSPLTTIRRERALPVPGSVTVRVNQKVQASDVIAEAEVNRSVAFLDVSRALGVPERQVERLLARPLGQPVEAGEVLAGPAGIARRTVRAPTSGRMVAISGGRVLFEASGEPFALRAGFDATVITTDGVQLVTLETTGALVEAAWGNGKHDFGVLRQVGHGPGDRLQTDHLDINLRGAVLLGGICDNPAPLHQATELSARGLILGSMPSDLVPAAMRLAYPIVLTEGFGRTPMNAPAYLLLQTNVGREVSVDGRMGDPFEAQRPEVIISLPANRQAALPEEMIQLKAGVRVRVLRSPHKGAVGVVRQVLPKAVALPSGILARSANVDLEGVGAATVPLANLEVIQ